MNILLSTPNLTPVSTSSVWTKPNGGSVTPKGLRDALRLEKHDLLADWGLVIGYPTPVPDGHVSTGHTWELQDGKHVQVHELKPIPLEDRKAAMQDAVRAKRWEIETGGITVNGAPIRTDEVSQGKITGAVNLFANDSELSAIDWEAMPGVWVQIDAPAMTAIGVAVGRHVQACFTRAKALSEAITAATDDSDLDAIDINAGWPGQ